MTTRTLNTIPYSSELSWPSSMRPFEALDFVVHSEPYAHYSWMREHAPVLRTATPGPDIWFVTRFADVRLALRTPKVFSSAVVDPVPVVMLTAFDAPEHSRYRQVATASFTAKAVGRLEEHLEQLAGALIDGMLERGGGDVSEEYASVLTMATISTLIGLPPENFEQMRYWSDRFADFIALNVRQGVGEDDDEVKGTQEFFAYIREHLPQIAARDEETVGKNVMAQVEAGVLSEQEAVEFCTFLYVAGHETTTLFLANAFRTLSERPEILGLLREDPEKWTRQFVEELSRFRGTVQRATRITMEDVEVAGTVIPKGEIVKLLPTSANRDSLKFPNGDAFDITRDASGHIAFGYGAHSCIGAPLARLEAKVTARVLSRKVGALQVSPEHPLIPVLHGGFATAGPKSMHMYLEPFREITVIA